MTAEDAMTKTKAKSKGRATKEKFTPSALRKELESLRQAARTVLFDHAHAISAGVSEGLLDGEEAQESVELNLGLAKLLGLTKDVRGILPAGSEDGCTCTFSGEGDHLCAVHGTGPG